MNSDIRLSVDFFSHPKTIKLIRRLGADGVLCLQRLWLFAAKHRVDGKFIDMDAEEMEIAAGWSNDCLTNRSTVVNGVVGFVDTLVELRWLDVVDGVYELHGWLDNNGYAASADDRSDKSRFSRMAKTHPQIYADLKAKGFSAISSDYYKKLTTPVRVSIPSAEEEALHFEANNIDPGVNEPLNESLTNRSSPLPSPLPSPKEKKPTAHSGFVLPEWVPIESWLAFLEMRKKIKKPMTERAMELAIKKLDAMRSGGHDVAVILDNSVLNSWQDLYPPKPSQFAETKKEPEIRQNSDPKLVEARRRANEAAKLRADSMEV